MSEKRKRLPRLKSAMISIVKDFVAPQLLCISLGLFGAFSMYTLIGALSVKSSSAPYRFCLATETSDTCVQRPGIVLSNKVSRSPDKLLKFFGGIPERVQRKWRVWIQDVEQSKTTELTVAEFYAWIDSVWNAPASDDLKAP